jgi:hypothetical protein
MKFLLKIVRMESGDLIKEIITVFLQEFTPAHSIAESDEFISTSEIAEKIDDFIASAKQDNYEYHKQIIDELQQVGFKYKLVGNQFKWLLKEKINS